MCESPTCCSHKNAAGLANLDCSLTIRIFVNVGMADKAVLYSCLCFFREFGEVGAAKPDVVRLSEEAQPPLGGCVLKPSVHTILAVRHWSAASRRLCVETRQKLILISSPTQPPLGGCVLKPTKRQSRAATSNQPPLGGCILKRRGRHPFPARVG